MSDPSGTWYNELGSVMQLTVSDSSLTGSYQTGVGNACGAYPLTGGLDPKPGGSIALGWTVAWVNEACGSSHSVTTWCGQYQVVDGGEEIVALWLLTSETAPGNDWESTLVNKDVFTRQPPTEDEIARSKKRVARSHPLNAGVKSARRMSGSSH